jgi:hypothetical protein
MLIKVLGRSMSSPIHLAVAASAAGSSLWFHLWPLAALGGMAYAALVASDVASPEFWKRTFGETKPERTPPRGLESIRDAELRRMAAEIRRARHDLDTIVRENAQIAVQVVSVLGSVAVLDDRADAVVRNADLLASFLGRTNTDAICEEIADLRARASTTRDAMTREQYERAAATREEQLKAVSDIAAALERAQANLKRIIATFEGISARVIRMSTMDSADTTNVFGDMNTELEEVNRDLASFEEVLRQLQPTGALS